MKILGVLSTAVVFLLLIGRAPAYSQDRDESKQDQTQEQKDKAKNNDKNKARQNQDKTSMPDANANRHEERSQPEATPQQGQNPRQDQRMDQGRGERPAVAHRGKHIDDAKFHASFGRQHTFKVQRTQVINNPQPVIVYGGYSFQVIDAWPATWSFDDDAYIDYIDGDYFLIDVFHPEIRVAVFILE